MRNKLLHSMQKPKIINMLQRTILTLACLIVAAPDYAQWTQTNGPYGAQIQCFAANGNNIFAGTRLGGVFLSADNGNSWQAMSAGLTYPATDVRALLMNGSNLFAATYAGVFLSSDSGHSWSKAGASMPAVPIISLNAIGSKIFAGTMGTGVYASSDDGNSWTPSSTGMPLNGHMEVAALACIGTNLFACTDSGVYLLTCPN